MEDAIADRFRIELLTLLIANKCDLDPDPEEVGVGKSTLAGLARVWAPRLVSVLGS